MIKANELRIGNWVIDNEFNEAIQLSIIYPVMDEFTPIPLTAEILEKCGFEDRGDSVYQSEKIDLFFTDLGCLLLVEERSNFNFTYVYLHELQNLYFVLTGEELEVKL